MTDTLKHIFAPLLAIIGALVLLIFSDIRDALFSVIFDIIDGILESFGIIGLTGYFFTFICMVPSFIEITILFSLMAFIAGLFSFILGLLHW